MEVSICQSAASYASIWAVFGRFFLTLLYTLFGLKILMFWIIRIQCAKYGLIHSFAQREQEKRFVKRSGNYRNIFIL